MQKKDTYSEGVLLVAHGSRDAGWAEPFEKITLQLAAGRMPGSVALAFLDYQAPSAREAALALAHNGCQRVLLAPMFLGAGRHAHEDMQQLLADLRAAQPAVQWQLLPTLGEIPNFHNAAAAVIASALAAQA